MRNSAGRPLLIKGNSQLLFSGMGRLTESCVLVMKNKSFTITAEGKDQTKELKEVIIDQGGAFGGMSFYTKNGKAKFAYNFFGLQTFTTEAEEAIPAGKHQVRMQFAYDGGGLGKGGNVTLYYDAKKVGEGRVGSVELQCYSPSTRRQMSVGTPAPPCRRITQSPSVTSTGR